MNIALMEFLFDPNWGPTPPPPVIGSGKVPLPFSRRTTAAVTVFACIFVSKSAQQLTTNPVLQGALLQEYSQLNQVYAVLIHQDTANNAADLEAAITTALSVIAQLNATVRSIVPTTQNALLVANAVAGVEQALYMIQLVQMDEGS